MKLDKKWFYKFLKENTNKYLPIYIDMSLTPDDLRYRLHFSWENIRPNGEFNPMMVAQLIDTTKQGWEKYIVPDLHFNCLEEDTTTDFKLYKFLNRWIESCIFSD